MYPTSTTQAIAGNLSKIAQAFMPMFDPEALARADEARRSQQLFPLKLKGLELENGLTSARTLTEGAQKGYYEDQSGLIRDKRSYQQTQNHALDDLYGRGPLPEAPAASGPMPTIAAPFTNYSKGSAVGGPDEMQDPWTNKGYSATGKNLTPGMVAVNPSRHPLGTVFRDPRTGETFIAGDRHGNSNPDVIDFYQEPSAYQRADGTRNLQVIGREDKVGSTPQEVAAQLAKWAQTIPQPAEDVPVMPEEGVLPALVNVPIETTKIANSGIQTSRIAPADQARLAAVAGLNPEIFMGGQARAEALQGGFNEARGREIALAQGLMPSQTTAITPEYQLGRDTMANSADLLQATEVARINQQGGLAQEDLRGRYGIAGDMMKPFLPGSTRGAGGASMPGLPESFNDMQKLGAEAAAASYQTFGVKVEDGVPGNDPFAGVRRAWQESYTNLRKAGHTAPSAAATANTYHFGTPDPQIVSEDTFRMGFGSDPAMPQVKNTEPLQVQAQMPASQGQSNFAAAIPQILGMLGLANMPQQTPVPVSGADAPAEQENPVPQTGPKPQGKRLGDVEQARKNDATSQVGSKYNDTTLLSVLNAVKRGASLEDIAATAFASDKGNDEALNKILVIPGSNLAMRAGSRSANDVRNALMDGAALQRAGIDPALIRQYIPGQAASGGSLDDEVRARAAKYLNR